MTTVHPDLEAYYDEEMSSSQRRALAEHVSRCSVCQQELAERRTLSALLRAVPAPGPRRSVAEVRRRLPMRTRTVRTGLVCTPLALAFLSWSIIMALYRLVDLWRFLPASLQFQPWWLTWIQPLLGMSPIREIIQLLSLGGWLGWDDWAWMGFSLVWAGLSAGLLALEWAWVRHQTQFA